jgi:histidinol-phosphatase (PHP family)
MPSDQLPAHVEEVGHLADLHRDEINVLLAAEVDFIPSPEIRAFQDEVVFSQPLDYVVGSVHVLGNANHLLSFNGLESRSREILHEEYDSDIRAMVEDYFARVRMFLVMPKVRIIGHLDLIKRWNNDGVYFHEDDNVYRTAVDKTLDEITAAGHVVELNTSG